MGLYNMHSFVSGFFHWTLYCKKTILFCVDRLFFTLCSFLFMHPLYCWWAFWVVHFGAITNRATINIPAHIFGLHRHTIPLHICLEVDYCIMGYAHLLLIHAAKQFSKVSIYTPTSNMRTLFAPHPHQHLVISFCLSGGCVVVYHCDFNLHFPDD